MSSKLDEKLKIQATPKNWISLDQTTLPVWAHREAVVIFKLYTQHDYLAGDLLKISISPNPFCTIWGEFRNNDHILHCIVSWSFPGREVLGGEGLNEKIKFFFLYFSFLFIAFYFPFVHM